MPRYPYGMALAGPAVLALLALVPASFPQSGGADTPAFYGMAEMVHRGVDGETVSSHIVHNRLLDLGEQVTIGLVFGDFDVVFRPSVICVTDGVDMATLDGTASESLATDDFNPTSNFGGEDSTLGTDTCVHADIDTATDTSVAVMSADFTGGVNFNTSQAVESIVICTASETVPSLTSCDHAGVAFAAVGVPPTMVGDAETLGITYAFNLTSENS